MSTLASINETLITQNTVLGLIGDTTHQTARGIERLNAYFDASADDAREAEAENRGDDQADQQTQTSRGQTSSGGGGLFDMLSKGGFLSSILSKAAIGALLGSIAVVLSDEIGNFVSSITGSDILGSLAEYGLVGAGLGSIFGIKGAAFGAMIGAVVGAANLIGDEVQKFFKENEIPGDAVAGEVAKTLTLAGSGALAGFAMGGPVGAIIGGLAGATVGVTGTLIEYFGDPKFQKAIDDDINEIKSALDDIYNNVNSFLEENVQKPLVSAADSVREALGMSTSEDYQAEAVKAVDAEIADVRQQISDMRDEALALRREANNVKTTGLKGAERQAARDQIAALQAQSDEIEAAANKLSRDEIGAYGRLTKLKKDTVAEVTAAKQDERTTVNEMAADATQAVIDIGNRNVPPQVTTPAQTGAEVAQASQTMREAESAASGPAQVVGQVGDNVTNNNSQNIIGNGVMSTMNPAGPYWTPVN